MTNPNQLCDVLLFVCSRMADETNLSSKLPVADRTREVWGRKFCWWCLSSGFPLCTFLLKKCHCQYTSPSFTVNHFTRPSDVTATRIIINSRPTNVVSNVRQKRVSSQPVHPSGLISLWNEDTLHAWLSRLMMCPVEADDVPSEELCYFHQGIFFSNNRDWHFLWTVFREFTCNVKYLVFDERKINAFQNASSARVQKFEI